MNDTLDIGTDHVMVIRLTRPWISEWEEIEPGYFRNGRGWRDGMSDLELADSARAWWRMQPRTITRRGIEYAVVAADGLTRSLFRIDDVIGPRSRDGRYALALTRVTSGPEFDRYVGPDGKIIRFARGDQSTIRYLGPVR